MDCRRKILQTLTKMFGLRCKVLPENRDDVEAYLDTICSKIVELTSYLQSQEAYIPSPARKKIMEYAEGEEARLKGILKDIQYDVDAPETVSLILGNRPVEKVCEAWECFWLQL